MTHIIAPGEDHLHTLSTKCKCHPIIDTDDETGKKLCTHLPLSLNIEVLPKHKDDEEDLIGIGSLFG